MRRREGDGHDTNSLIGQTANTNTAEPRWRPIDKVVLRSWNLILGCQSCGSKIDSREMTIVGFIEKHGDDPEVSTCSCFGVVDVEGWVSIWSAWASSLMKHVITPQPIGML